MKNSMINKHVLHVICKQKLSVLETKQRWNARR